METTANVTKSQMIEVVNQFNAIMHLDPEIPTGKKATIESLDMAIRDFAGELCFSDLENTDPEAVTLTADAIATLTAMNVPLPTKKEVVDVKAEKAKKAVKKEKYTRANALAEALRAGITDVKLVHKKTDELYVEHGNKTNMKEAEFYNTNAIRALVALGLATYEKGVVTMLK